MPKVAINAGHCPGLDSGACGEYSQEADICKKIAEKVCDYLQFVGYDTLFIQENELCDITDMSDNFLADVFVSIHNNAANGRAEGIETFNYYGSTKGKRLANYVQSQLINTFTDHTDRGVKEAGFYVIKHTNAPACLVECEFIDNPEQEKFLNKNIDGIAAAIARGVTDYFAGI